MLHYEPHRVFYVTEHSEGKTVITTDLNLYNHPDLMHRPFLLKVSVQIKAQTVDGLFTPEEFEVLDELDQALEEALVQKQRALLAGRYSSKGEWTGCFYMNSDETPHPLIESIVESRFHYLHRIDLTYDPDHTFYANKLYPSPREYRSILNQEMVEELQEQGDNSEIPRRIDHWIQFQTLEDRNHCLYDLDGSGFEIEPAGLFDPDPRYPFPLQVYRSDRTDNASINEITSYLWDMAQNHNGRYEGWETIVVDE